MPVPVGNEAKQDEASPESPTPGLHKSVQPRTTSSSLTVSRRSQSLRIGNRQRPCCPCANVMYLEPIRPVLQSSPSHDVMMSRFSALFLAAIASSDFFARRAANDGMLATCT